jgi:RNA polymerase sigma factor (sigma-70 family)
MDDWRHLRRFVEEGSQEAFSCLVSAHVDLVYSAALRQVKDKHLAEDVTQSVFMVLARKAGRVRPGASLAAWLLVTTRYLALDALDAKATRERHEREAAAMAKTETLPIDPAQWDAISPHLDAALASLNGKDREAITLRYFQNKSFKEVADAMGSTVEAARQRVHRATMRMRAFFSIHGAQVSLDAIGALIVAHAVQAAPPGLAGSATAAGAAAARTAGGALTGKGMVLLMALTKTKIAIGTAVVLLVCGGAVVAYKATLPSNETVVIRSGSQAQSVAEPSSDWDVRMNEVYGLADGQDVKQAPAPAIPERQLYWAKHGNGMIRTLPADAGMIFNWDGSKLQWQTFNTGPGTLWDFLTLCAGLRTWEIDSSVPAGMKTGDWVVRKGASTQRLMDALGPIVSARLGRAVRFERRRVSREAVVARGTYHFVPLPGHKDDGIIEMLGEKPASFLALPHSESLRQFLEGLDKYTYRKVFVEIDSPAQPVKVREGDFAGEAEAKAIMKNFAAQSSLHFDRERRQMDVWFMVDSNGTTLPATQP